MSKRDFTPLRAPGRGQGGWYCDQCGYITRSLPSGMVTCSRCGSLGLMGFTGAAPRKMPCLEGGCPHLVWFDGVNSYPARLLRIHNTEHALNSSTEVTA